MPEPGRGRSGRVSESGDLQKCELGLGRRRSSREVMMAILILRVAGSQWRPALLCATYPRDAVTLQLEESHSLAMSLDVESSKRFGEDVCHVDLRRDIEGFHGLHVADLVSDPEFLNGDVFHPTVVDGIVEDLDGGRVVDAERGWDLEVESEFAQEVLHPLEFRASE